MPHECMNCGKTYPEDADELLDGCECGSTLFLYQRSSPDADAEGDEQVEEPDRELPAERESVMEEIDRFISDVKNRVASDANVEFDLESIKVTDDGVYEINLRKLLDEVPLIVEIKEGRYHIHLASVFSGGKNKGLRVQDLDDVEIDDELRERLEAAAD